MNPITLFIIYAVVLLGGLNLLRIAVMLIATDLHEIREHRLKKRTKDDEPTLPWLTVIIPAYNEEKSIVASLDSVCKNDYPLFDVIVVDDGSKDRTAEFVKYYIDWHPESRVHLEEIPNGGKAHALNHAIRKVAYGDLVMCLDADSLLAPDAISKTVAHFERNPKLVGMASNVHVTGVNTAIGLMQKFEYMLSYRLKRALNLLKSEYIIGGVGSTFRKDFIEGLGMYDTDTMTEDIDLTLKVVSQGNKEHQLGFGYDVHTYTQGVLNFKDLVKQRFRWKYGRMQSFLKNRSLFFNRDKKYSKTLTMFQLPYAVFGEIALLIEPLFVTFIVVSSILFLDFFSILWIFGFMMFYMSAVIMNDRQIPFMVRIELIGQIPLVWLLFYVLSLVEFLALMKCLVRLPKIKQSMINPKASSWEHVQRAPM